MLSNVIWRTKEHEYKYTWKKVVSCRCCRCKQYDYITWDHLRSNEVRCGYVFIIKKRAHRRESEKKKSFFLKNVWWRVVFVVNVFSHSLSLIEMSRLAVFWNDFFNFQSFDFRSKEYSNGIRWINPNTLIMTIKDVQHLRIEWFSSFSSINIVITSLGLHACIHAKATNNAIWR